MTADPREIKDTQHGTPIRDGAVTPRDGDYLPPTNAGKPGELGNPHGPHVVAPEIHASQGTRPVRPGPVDPDPTTQSTDETTHLVEHVPTAATPAATEPDDPGTGG